MDTIATGSTDANVQYVVLPPTRKRFRLLRGAWKLLVAIKDALVLLAMLLFFGAIWAALTSRPGTVSIGTGALVLKLNGTIVEQTETPGPGALLGGQAPVRQFALRSLVQSVNAAATDDRVKAVVLDLDGFMGGGAVALSDVGAALDRVRAAKKPVLAYATGYSDDSYQLAAHASQIWLDPMGLALFAGPGGSRLYYKGLIDKLGVTAHVYRVGKFKSAVEPYIRPDQSPEAKAENVALAGILYQGWLADIAKARPQAKMAAFAGDPIAATAGGDLSQAALAAGIVDKLGDKAAFEKTVAGLVGVGKKDIGYAKIDLKPWTAANARPTGSSDIAVVTVAGVISDGEAGPGGAGGTTIAKQIDTAVAGGKYKAIVLRVDSPGGSALASEKIRVALMAAKSKGLPIIVSMGNVAASGGYWVAMAGDKVFAEPTTITGSIGVFGIIPTFEGALAKAGVTTDGVRTTPLSGQPDILGGTNAAFDTVIQRSIESTYGRFIALVAGARKIDPAKVNEIAQGRVWDGGTARQLNLVDAFGGIDDAIAEAARRAKLDPAAAHAVWIEKEPTFLQGLVANFTGEDDEASDAPSTDLLSTMARVRMMALGHAIADAQLLIDGAAVQARCLECPATTAPTATVPPRAWNLFLNWMTR